MRTKDDLRLLDASPRELFAGINGGFVERGDCCFVDTERRKGGSFFCVYVQFLFPAL